MSQEIREDEQPSPADAPTSETPVAGIPSDPRSATSESPVGATNADSVPTDPEGARSAPLAGENWTGGAASDAPAADDGEDSGQDFTSRATEGAPAEPVFDSAGDASAESDPPPASHRDTPGGDTGSRDSEAEPQAPEPQAADALGDGAPMEGAVAGAERAAAAESPSESRDNATGVDTPTAEPVGEEVPVGPDGQPLEFNWYVLRVQSGREDTCSNALKKKVMLAKMDHHVREVAVPKQKVTEIKDGKRRVRAQKLFPGYIFLHMALEDDLWYLIRDTSGIGDFVGSHRKPIPMRPSEVKDIMAKLEEKEETPQVQIDLAKNDMVKVKGGPFENFDGVVEEVHPSKGMVRVMVTIFGRATPVDLEYWEVEKL